VIPPYIHIYGFDSPFDRGTIARTGPLRAVFVSSVGTPLELSRLLERPDHVTCR
jgi:hypothetical protein